MAQTKIKDAVAHARDIVASGAMRTAPDPIAGAFPAARRGAHRSLWLIWTGLGLTTILNLCGTNPFVAQGAGACCFLCWVALNVEMNKVVWEVLFSFSDIFFREVGVRGNFNIPQTGPVIFAIAPHANQFLDPIIVGATSNRDDIGFVTAAATFRRKFVGRLAKWINGIPVERAQDLAKVYPGTASVNGAAVVGEGTQFTKLQVGGILFFKSLDPVPILKIVDDTHLELKYPVKNDVKDMPFKAAPRVDQETFFSEVFNSLQMGKAVGVFPEGGSHDKTHFLEMKPGVALFCLGGSVKSGKPVPVVPVGLNYFKGHRFHSRVFVDYGVPIYPSEEQLKSYQSSDSSEKREATSSLLNQIKEGLSNVTVETPDFDTLQLFWALRRLYVPSGEKIDDSVKQTLTRGFAEGYAEYKSNERVKKLIQDVTLYMEKLKQYGLRDYQVGKTMMSKIEARENDVVDRTALLLILARRLILLILWSVVWIPAGAISLPFIAVTRVVAQRQARLAVLKSSVKIAGRDVIGTWKVLVAIGLWPTMHFLYTFLVYWYFGQETGQVWAAIYFFFMPFISLANLKSQENMAKLFRSISPILLLMKDQDVAFRLVYLREKCRQETVAVVDEVGWGKAMKFQTEEAPLSIQGRSMSFDDLIMVGTSSNCSSPRAFGSSQSRARLRTKSD